MRILVVEDEHKIANSIKRGLEQETHAVDVAYDGEDGYGRALTEEYDVIILDIMMPKMNGVEVCRKLRSRHIHTPILMLTAKGQVSDKVDGLNSGADDYLVKPFAFIELLARIRALSRRPKKSIDSTIIVDDLCLNSITYSVTRDGRRVELSKKEYSLLEYLMRNKDRVLSKDQIISHVWDYEADILPNTVEVYIGYLRNKVDKPFPDSDPLIHTVRGFGYKIGRNK
jgi:two-component system, OmpR family, response regulator